MSRRTTMRRNSAKQTAFFRYVSGLSYVIACFAVTLMFATAMVMIGKLFWYAFKALL